MVTYSIFENTVVFDFNSPAKECGYIAETFDKEHSIYTRTVESFLAENNAIDLVPFIAGRIVGILHQKARGIPLDYLQKLTVNGELLWCIDDGNSVCLMFPEDY